jgi:hypothetical protein
VNPIQYLNKITRIQDSICSSHVRVARTRILGQVADGAPSRDVACSRKTLSSQYSGESGLACTISTDKTNPVTGSDSKLCLVK